MGLGIFFYKVTCHPKLKWALDLFTMWPHYKMTHKNPFSGLKATHFVWEIRRRILGQWRGLLFTWPGAPVVQHHV
jgi:hypothetical protein